MTIDTKALFEKAKEELKEERNSPINVALRKIMKIERNHYYNKGSSHSRLKDIRGVISDYSNTEND